MSGLRELSKRYGANLDRFPSFTRKMFEQMSREAQLPALRSAFKEVPIEKRYRTPEQWKVQVGDRVLLTKGKYKGQVTKVVALHNGTNRLFVELAETKKVIVPKQYWQAGQYSHVLQYPQSVHANDVKVVGTLVKTAKDGTEVEKEIAADQVVFKGEYWDDDYKKMMPYRRVKFHEDFIIPWPRPEPAEDDTFSTPKEETEERTYFPESLVRTDAPTGIVKSMRDPLMKRPYKWNKKYITKSEAKKLSTPDMPLSETKKAMFAERKAVREAYAKEPAAETVELVGKKVAELLNNVTDPNFAKYVQSKSPTARKERDEKKAAAKKVADEKLRERQEMNKIRKRVEDRYKSKRR